MDTYILYSVNIKCKITNFLSTTILKKLLNLNKVLSNSPCFHEMMISGKLIFFSWCESVPMWVCHWRRKKISQNDTTDGSPRQQGYFMSWKYQLVWKSHKNNKKVSHNSHFLFQIIIINFRGAAEHILYPVANIFIFFLPNHLENSFSQWSAFAS